MIPVTREAAPVQGVELAEETSLIGTIPALVLMNLQAMEHISTGLIIYMSDIVLMDHSQTPPNQIVEEQDFELWNPVSQKLDKLLPDRGITENAVGDVNFLHKKRN